MTNPSAKIKDHSDCPDFIISWNGKEIGLEHERIFRQVDVKKINSIKELFKQAAALFEIEHPDIKIIATCYLKNNEFNFKKSQIDKLKKEISDYIFTLVSKNCLSKKPAYIDEITFYNATIVCFEYHPGA